MNGADETLWPSRTSDTRVLDQFSMICTVMYGDDSAESLGVDAFSVHGAQLEITGYLISQGYEPAGRWEPRGGRC